MTVWLAVFVDSNRQLRTLHSSLFLSMISIVGMYLDKIEKDMPIFQLLILTSIGTFLMSSG